MTKIVLDAEAFKALASDTRLHILKALDARPLTVSELSRLLTLNKATVFEHLKQLMAADLAKREDDPARKWVYYRLTWKGKNVLHPENAQIFLMLGMAALGLGGAVLQTAYLAQLWLAQKAAPASSAPSTDLFRSAQESMLVDEGGSPPADEPQSAAAYSSGAPGGTTGSASAGDQAAKSTGAASPGPTADTTGGAVEDADVMPVRADAEFAASAEQSAWWQPLTSNYFLTLVGILVFLGLLTLIVWTLYSGQRKERDEMRKRVNSLPADINHGEPQIGTPA